MLNLLVHQVISRLSEINVVWVIIAADCDNCKIHTNTYTVQENIEFFILKVSDKYNQLCILKFEATKQKEKSVFL